MNEQQLYLILKSGGVVDGNWAAGNSRRRHFYLGSPFLARVSAIVGLNRKRQLVTLAQTWLVRFFSINSTVILNL